MLQEMLDKQLELQKRLGYDIENMDVFERTDYIKEFSIHLTQELHELLYELVGFKPWKDYSGVSLDDVVIQHDKSVKEFIDLFHFVLNLALALGIDAAGIHERYMEKNKENHKRQDEGYTHDKSYR